MEERLQKILAAAGVGSRRQAEAYLRAGAVTVNGLPAHLGQRADPVKDDIRLRGRPLPGRERPVYILLHKPRGYLTTVRDERGRRTVMDLLRGVSQRVYPVGRLDRGSEGLLLLTNDGALAHRLLHPSHEIEKEYHVTVSGPVEDAAERLSALRDVEGEPIGPPRAALLRRSGPHRACLQIVIHEGRNRQIRRMCAQCGLEVLRLRRVREGRVTLSGLPSGAWRHLTEGEVAALWGDVRPPVPSGGGDGQSLPSEIGRR